jgi:hypothetical protein
VSGVPAFPISKSQRHAAEKDKLSINPPGPLPELRFSPHLSRPTSTTQFSMATLDSLPNSGEIAQSMGIDLNLVLAFVMLTIGDEA